MIKVTSTLPANGNAYILFGFEAIQARPNLDPYSSTLRTNDETGQVFTSDVHIKHHVRRGLKAYAVEKNLPHSTECVFYEKTDDTGKSCDFKQRLEKLCKAAGIKNDDNKAALHNTLDLPLFGYVCAIEQKKFNVTNAANTLFRPVTFHDCPIYSLGRNNAFPTKENASAGSATVDSLEYGFFLALWEINLNMLRINAAGNKLIDWETEGSAKWLEALVNGMWKAYSSDRYPSFTQRSQFAQFLIGWVPGGDVSYANPASLYDSLDETLIKTHSGAVAALNKVLPAYLSGWDCRSENIFVKHKAANFPVVLPGE